jgi:hypothetical protein
LTDLLITVLLEPDEDDPAIYNVSVPGLPGHLSTFGEPRAAIVFVQGALERALEGMDPDERRAMLAHQAAVKPGRLAPGSRMERIPVRAALPA